MMMARRWLSREARAVMAVSGEADPVAGIIALASDLIDETGIDEPPFHPHILASFRNVREIRLRPMQSAARLVPDPATQALVIEVNQEHSLGKRNFSADHEITHTLLPTYSRQLVDDRVTGEFPAGSEDELLCDIGAAALLLDERWLRPLAVACGPSLSTLFHLAELFAASLEATARKLASLDLWPCAFVFWEEGFRACERVADHQGMIPLLEPYGRPLPKLRVTRRYVCRPFGIYVPQNKSVEDTSLVATCCERTPLTRGIEMFDFGHCGETLYCENAHVPYRSGGVTRRRVLSLLVRTRVDSEAGSIPELFRLEGL
jgi:hypothetical protein